MQRTLLPLLFLLAGQASAQLSCTFDVTVENCSEGNGTATAYVYGGTPPYSFLWTPAPPSGQGTSVATGLSAGSYDLLVTDVNAVQQTFTAVVTNIPELGFAGPGSAAMAEPYVGQGVPCTGECNGAMAFPANLIGGTQPYTFDWGPPVAYTVQGDPIFTGFCAGQSYTYTVTDALGCSATGSTGQVPELEPGAHWTVSTITPASCGNSDGVVTVSQLITWPADVQIYQGGNLVQTTSVDNFGNNTLSGLAAGSYTALFQYAVSACESSLSFTMPEVGPGCGFVEGTLFLDSDSDCGQDAGESGIPYRTVQVDPGAQLAITNADGSFATGLVDGNYTLQVLDPTVTPVCPQAQPIPFTIAGNSVTLDVAAASSAPVDLSISVANSAARPGFGHELWVQVTNLGAATSDPIEISCVLDADVTYAIASPAPTTVFGNALTWSLPALAGYASISLQVGTYVSTQATLGQLLTHDFTVVNGGAEPNTSNNSFASTRTVTGSYDPNDKTASTSTRQSTTDYVLGQDEWIDYVIRFQNTGTDTAFTVVVTDTLAAELDMSTYEQGAASHPFTVSFLPGRVVEWRFANILLPDSTTNEPASNGALSFRIRPVQPLAVGTVLANNADIFFDFNVPIRTNTSNLVASVSTGVPFVPSPRDAQGNLWVFPNPAQDRLFISSTASLRSLRILALDGRTVLVQGATGLRSELDLRGLPAGAYVLVLTTADGMETSRRIAVH